MEQTIITPEPVSGSPLDHAEQDFKAKFITVAKDSLWQRLLLFSILFPIGILTYIYSWAASISGMVNLSGDVGNRAIFILTSLISLALVRPATYAVSLVSSILSRFTEIAYIDSPLLFYSFIAVYVFILSSVVVMLLWKVFSKIPKWLCVSVVIILWVSMSWLSYSWYSKGYLKDIIGENPSLAKVYTEEDDTSWNDGYEKAREAFSAWPVETINDVMIYQDIAGFSPNQVVYNDTYEISSQFQLNYQTVRNEEVIGNVGIGVTTYGSKVYLYQYVGNLSDSDSMPLVELEDGNKIKAMGTNRENWTGYSISWTSGRRMINVSGGYTPNSGLEDEFDQLVEAYLIKYPSDLQPGESEYMIRSQNPARNGSTVFEDTLDKLSFELPEGTIAFKYVDSKGNFIAADKSDNNFSITSDPKMVLCCEGPILRKYEQQIVKIDDYVNNLSWAGEIISKRVISDRTAKIYYIEAHPTIASPYKVIIMGTGTGREPVQLIELNMPDKVLETIFNEYYKVYSNK